jgi:hypothetical protein
VAYEPSAQPFPHGEPWDSTQRMAEESRKALAAVDLVGRPEDDARRRAEAVGLAFRAAPVDGVLTADFSATRVTATVVDGVVLEARIG